MFIMQNPENKKIFLNLPHADSTAPKSHHIHFGVTCDNCEAGPIIGFRYKCLECDDFDLCAACEGKMAHTEHMMIRLPGDIKNLSTAKAHHGKKRHGHGHHGKRHSRCPIGIGGILNTIEDLNLQTAMKNSERQSSSSSGEASPKKEDPNNKKYEEHMKTSMDMLSNFHKMFSKILDPLGSDIIVDIRREANDEKEKEKVAAENKPTENGHVVPEKAVPEEDKMDEAAASSITEDSNWELIHKERSSSPEVVPSEIPEKVAAPANLYPEMRAVLVPEKVATPAEAHPEMRAVLVTDCGSKMDVDDKAENDKAKIAQEESARKIYHSSKFSHNKENFVI